MSYYHHIPIHPMNNIPAKLGGTRGKMRGKTALIFRLRGAEVSKNLGFDNHLERRAFGGEIRHKIR
jgi:hypothetical protein